MTDLAAQLRSHDWRVDPNQLIVTVGTEVKLRVCCVDCPAVALVYSRPNHRINARDRRTWREYRPMEGDRMELES